MHRGQAGLGCMWYKQACRRAAACAQERAGPQGVSGGAVFLPVRYLQCRQSQG